MELHLTHLGGGVAVVTGAASGIVLALARALGEGDMQVVLADIERDRLDEAHSALAATGIRVVAEPCDVSDAESVQDLADRVERSLGPVRVLCNNAGVGPRGG